MHFVPAVDTFASRYKFWLHSYSE